MLQVLSSQHTPSGVTLRSVGGDNPDASALRIAVGNLASINDMAAGAGLTPNQQTASQFQDSAWAANRTALHELRAMDSMDPVRVRQVMDARDHAWDNNLRVFVRAYTAARLTGHPDPRAYATDAARRGWRAHCTDIDAAMVADAAGAGAAYPRLIAMMAMEERKPTAVGSFARCFPRVIPGLNAYPGIQSYPVVRTEFKGQPGPISGASDDSLNEVSFGQDQDLRWTEILGFVIREEWIQGLRAQLPGIAPVNRGDLIRYAQEAMDAALSLVQWFGRGVGKPGLLRDPAVQRVGDSSTTLSKTGDPIQAAQRVLSMLSDHLYNMKDTNTPDTAIFGSRISALLNKFPVSSSGTVAVEGTAWTMLTGALNAAGITRIEKCWELDHLSDPDGSPADDPTADTNWSGIWVGRGDAVSRAEILPPMLLPEVEGLLVRRAAYVAQIGQPHHDGTRPSKLLAINITA